MVHTSRKYSTFNCLRLCCGQLPVVLGAGRACDLAALSFADVLNEEIQQGYQRPFDPQHSREFRNYIEQRGATTIPLTFNLRGPEGDAWYLTPVNKDGTVVELAVRTPSSSCPPVLAQVDCQHRLGTMRDSPVELTFQCYLGLTPQEEMAIFNIINGKAKGLSSSLLDYHTTKLVPGLETVQLDLYIAKTLHDDQDSVWYHQVKLGGAATQGNKRRVSLRALQAATKLLLQRCPLGSATELAPPERYMVIRSFWQAVCKVWPAAWEQPRTHLLTKGVGVTSLSLLAGDIITAVLSKAQSPNTATFVEYLSVLADLDWSSDGVFKAFGGRHGATEAHNMLTSKLFAAGLSAMRTGR